jgi:hypothetical protein
MRRALAAIVGAAAAASVALNVYPVFFEEPPELWHELHDMREALADAGDRICLPTSDIRGASVLLRAATSVSGVRELA